VPHGTKVEPGGPKVKKSNRSRPEGGVGLLELGGLGDNRNKAGTTYYVSRTTDMADSSQESPILHERKAHFRGNALINIKHLTFEDAQVPGTRALDEKHVAWLVQVFELEGCDRLDEDHRIPAIVSKTVLSDALKKSNISEDTLLNNDEPPRLRFDDRVRLTCLRGRHRIAAADEFLLPGDKLWVVDLFDDGTY
jgi:Protein of unknown function (DUF3723)